MRHSRTSHLWGLWAFRRVNSWTWEGSKGSASGGYGEQPLLSLKNPLGMPPFGNQESISHCVQHCKRLPLPAPCHPSGTQCGFFIWEQMWWRVGSGREWLGTAESYFQSHVRRRTYVHQVDGGQSHLHYFSYFPFHPPPAPFWASACNLDLQKSNPPYPS